MWRALDEARLAERDAARQELVELREELRQRLHVARLGRPPDDVLVPVVAARELPLAQHRRLGVPHGLVAVEDAGAADGQRAQQVGGALPSPAELTEAGVVDAVRRVGLRERAVGRGAGRREVRGRPDRVREEDGVEGEDRRVHPNEARRGVGKGGLVGGRHEG